MCTHTPGRLKFWTTRHTGQDAGRWSLVYEQGQQLQGRGIDPLRVFHNQQQGLLGGVGHEECQESCERLAALLLWREREGWIALRGQRQEQEGCEERYDLCQGQRRLAQGLFQLA